MDEVNTLLHLGFPLSYIVFWITIIIILMGVGAVLGVVGFIFIYGMMRLGMIKISPLLDKISLIIDKYLPDSLKTVRENINKSFKVIDLRKEKLNIKPNTIYSFHPHGAFSSSYYFHVVSHFTNWPIHKKIFYSTVSRYFFWSPFSDELGEKFKLVPNTYTSMKNVLEKGYSLNVIPGGTSEMSLTTKGKLIVSILKRKGMFKMALETGSPLVPVLSYGENEIYSLAFPSIQKWIQKHFHVCIPIPNIKSILTWLNLFDSPFDNPITSVIGDAIEVQKNENPSEKDIDTLKQMYIQKVKDLYKQTKPVSYAEEIEFV